MKFLKPKWAIEWWDIIKKEGVKTFLKKKGWKFFVIFVVFYLVRDITLYIIIPYLIVDNLVGC